MKLNQTRRIKQLQNASALLSESLSKVKLGDSKYLVVLGTQLRALICVGGRNFHPLFIELSEELNRPIECFGPPNTTPNNPLYDGLVFRISGRIIGFEPYSPAQRKYLLEEWLNANILVVDGLFYTPNEVLRSFADKEASHYDSRADLRMEKLKTILHHNYFQGKSINEIDRFLIQTAEFVIGSIKKLFISENQTHK